MNRNRVTLITLAVADMQRARKFYGALGWVSSFEGDEVTFFDMPGMKLGLFSRAGLARETRRKPGDLATGAMTLGQNFSDPAAVDAAHAQALAAGATEVTRPAATAWGGYSGYVADPDGHLWEFANNPFWPMDADGALSGGHV